MRAPNSVYYDELEIHHFFVAPAEYRIVNSAE